MPGPAPTAADKRMGRRIRLGREREGVSTTVLGERVGITRQAVEQYEVGKARVGAIRLKQIADALRLPITWFYRGI